MEALEVLQREHVRANKGSDDDRAHEGCNLVDNGVDLGGGGLAEGVLHSEQVHGSVLS